MRSKSRNLNLVFEQEVPTGAVNGSNTAFVLAQTPYSQKAVMLFLDGLALVYGVHFTVNVATKTITMIVAPATGQVLNSWYMRRT